MRHVGNIAVGLIVAARLHLRPVKNTPLHIVLKGDARHAFHNLVNELEGGIDVLILGARVEIQMVERAHVLHRGDIVTVEHKVAVTAGTGVGDARCVAHDVVQRDVVEERCLELGEEF